MINYQRSTQYIARNREQETTLPPFGKKNTEIGNSELKRYMLHNMPM